MKNYSKKTFRQTIISSVLIIVMSLISMIGGTFAWFTDTETVSSRIVSGKLDVEMLYSNKATSGEYKNIKTMGEKPLFFVDSKGNDILWEPGVVSVCDLKIQNVGNLALQYKLFTKFEDQLNEVAITDDTAKLSEVIKAVILPKTTLADRAAAIAAGEGAEGGWKTLAEIADEDILLASAEKAFTVVLYWQPTDHDDDYNMKNDNVEDVLSIKVDFNLFATQHTYEDDSYDINYDVLEDSSKPTIASLFEAMSKTIAAGVTTDSTKLPEEIFVIEPTLLAPTAVQVGDSEENLAPEIDGAETAINLKDTMSIGNTYQGMDTWGGLRAQGQSGRHTKVTFKGDENGLFTSVGSNVASLVYVEGSTEVIFESGTYETDCRIICYGQMGGGTSSVLVKGGTFKFAGATKDNEATFSSRNTSGLGFVAIGNDGLTITITGGKFYNCNPTGYVAPGYKVVSSEVGNDIIYEVVAE